MAFSYALRKGYIKKSSQIILDTVNEKIERRKDYNEGKKEYLEEVTLGKKTRLKDFFECEPIILTVPKEKKINIKLKMKISSKIFFGFLSGFISALMGIGGAVMNVPILKFFGYSINNAIGSAAAIGFLIAVFGALGFLITGSYLDVSLPLSIGFLNIPAFLIFIPVTTFMARIGARTVHKIDKQRISKYFGFFLLVIGSKFLFEYSTL